MNRYLAACAALPLALATIGTASAKSQDEEKKPTPITEQKVGADDVALTPLSDLNIKKTGIPPMLIAAQERPYALDGLRSCTALNGAVSDLNALLGDDIDVPNTDGEKMDAGRVAQSALGSLIPFRGLIRELSGANAQERKLQSAIIAGSTRRGFLKGMAQQKGCKGVARPATNGLVAFVDTGAKKTKDGTKIVARPVVQKTD